MFARSCSRLALSVRSRGFGSDASSSPRSNVYGVGLSTWIGSGLGLVVSAIVGDVCLREIKRCWQSKVKACMVSGMRLGGTDK